MTKLFFVLLLLVYIAEVKCMNNKGENEFSFSSSDGISFVPPKLDRMVEEVFKKIRNEKGKTEISDFEYNVLLGIGRCPKCFQPFDTIHLEGMKVRNMNKARKHCLACNNQ